MTEHRFARDGWTPETRGWQPVAVQGGYVPTATGSAAPPTPPTGGSAVKPPAKQRD